VAAATFAAAVAETLPARLDDNVRIGVACAAVFLAESTIAPERVPFALVTAAARAPAALAVDVVAGLAAYRVGVVDRSGLLAGAALGTALWAFGGPGLFAAFAALVAAAAASTRLGRARKEARGLAQGGGGRRGAAHALANAGAAAAFAFLAATSADPAGPALAAVAALATAAFDTAGTEVGQAFAGAAYLPLGLARVRPGTPGALSAQGTLAGAVASLLVAGVAAAAGVIPAGAVGAAVAGAAFGSLAEAVVASMPATGSILGPHGRNVLSTAVGAGASVALWHASGH
jgi:uncharacterized protein (TIGR00297 family)